MNTKKRDGRLVFFLAFALPVLALLLIFAVKGIYPFGDRSFLRTDMYHQYVPFHAEFAEKLQNGESLLYSWEVGAGSNFITLLAYYLCSPFNLLLFVISKAGIVEYTSYMVVLKTGLAGLTMAWYLCRKFDTRTVAAAFFSLAYGLSGYMAAYSWNIMWLDCIWLAPLVLLGLELLVEENKGLMYCLTLALSILTNYYISIMLCMFLVLYFVCLLIMYPSKKGTETIGEPKTRVRDYLYKCVLFAFYSLLAGGLAAVLLLPVAAALKTTASANINFPDSLSTYFNTMDMLARHMAGVETEIGLEHWPNLYSCAAVFVLFPLYIMNKNIPYKEKIVKCVLLLFMLISFAWNIPNFIWHGFHYPNSLPCRQSFLYTIVLLAMCFEALHNLRTASVGQIVGSLWGAVAFLFLCEQTVEASEIRFYVYYINIALIGLYGLFLYLYKRRKVSVPNIATLAFLLVFVEMTLNMGITSITTTGRTAYLTNTENFTALSEWADTEEGGTFFRMEKAVKKTKNDGAWAGYRSASIFSSTTNAAITKIYKQLGMEGSTNAYSFTGATPFVSSLLSVKYTLSTDEIDGPLTTLVQTSGTVKLYRNDYTLPLGFVIPSYSTSWNYSDANPIQVQNHFVSTTTSVSSIYTQVTSGSGTSYTFTAAQDGYYYGVLTDFSVKNIKAAFEEGSTTYSNVNRDFILDLGYLHAGEQVTLTGEDQKTVSINIYRLLEDNFIQAIGELNEQPLVVTSYSDTEIQATVNVTEAGILFTSIPYEEGWTVYVDGIPVATKAFADAFVSVDLTVGQHTITMKYMPVGLKEGAIISLVSLGILLIVVIVYLIRWRKAKKQAAASQSEMRIPVAERVQARPSDSPVQGVERRSYAERVRPAEISTEEAATAEVIPAEGKEIHTEDADSAEEFGSAKDSISAQQSALAEDPLPANEPISVTESGSARASLPAAEAPATDASDTDTASDRTGSTVAPESNTEKNPRLLAFEQMMRDLGGRIE